MEKRAKTKMRTTKAKTVVMMSSNSHHLPWSNRISKLKRKKNWPRKSNKDLWASTSTSWSQRTCSRLVSHIWIPSSTTSKWPKRNTRTIKVPMSRLKSKAYQPAKSQKLLKNTKGNCIFLQIPATSIESVSCLKFQKLAEAKIWKTFFKKVSTKAMKIWIVRGSSLTQRGKADMGNKDSLSRRPRALSRVPALANFRPYLRRETPG